MNDSIADRVTHGIAAAGLTSPIWLEWLDQVSKIAALLLPIVSLIWLILKVAEWLRTKDKKE